MEFTLSEKQERLLIHQRSDMAEPESSLGGELWERMETVPLGGTPIRVRGDDKGALVFLVDDGGGLGHRLGHGA
jgi:hypothetical protein